MQFGHVGLSLFIASFDWRPSVILTVLITHFLPNFDVFAIKAGFAKDDFHCSITHTLLFALIISALFLPFSPHLALFALISLVAHMLADLPSDIGQQIFWPVSKKKFTMALWKDTGYWGKATVVGSYEQPWPWLLESAVVVLFLYRLTVIY